ncbi:unnamed protein product [Rotaria sp. Silwood2]|nr:unnamed protein product [Rotaria sp. Silwood2]CAF4009542.1 unnamed protein product [Rotaria sp. Silwood2]
MQRKLSIMISDSHGDYDFCSQLLDSLNKHNDVFEIWIDRTHCQGVDDLWGAIAEGMEQASIIVCLLSNQYFESKSCRKEFIYAADSLKKKIVPILLVQFNTKGWLEQSKATELLNTILTSFSSAKIPINENLSAQSPHHGTPPASSHAVSPFIFTSTTQQTPVVNVRPIDEWISTGGDINSWFAQHRLSTELGDLYDFQNGEEMPDYAQLLMKNREKQMDIYTRIYAKKYNGSDLPPHEFNRFSRVLEQLLRDNRRPPSLVKTNSSVSNKRYAQLLCVIKS